MWAPLPTTASTWCWSVSSSYQVRESPFNGLLETTFFVFKKKKKLSTFTTLVKREILEKKKIMGVLRIIYIHFPFCRSNDCISKTIPVESSFFSFYSFMGLSLPAYSLRKDLTKMLPSQQEPQIHMVCYMLAHSQFLKSPFDIFLGIYN